MLLFLVSGCASVAEWDDEPKLMRIGNATPDDRSLSQAMFAFADQVEEETNGSIKVDVFTNSQLGGDRELLEGMQLNTVQGATISTGPIAQFSDSFHVFDLPFLFAEEESAYRVLDSEIGENVLAELEQENIIGLNFWENGFRMLSNNVREVETLEDIRGLDIRTLENRIHMQIWTELGANPVPINYGELYIAMEQGRVNGQENPVGNVVNSHFYEVQNFLTETNHIYNASPFMVSKPFWDSLTDEERDIIANASEEIMHEQREANQQEAADGIAFVKDQGMTVTELSDDEFERLRDAVDPVYERFRETYGGEVLDAIMDAAEQLEEGA
ncbi:LOW QUALITY PROTEIN: TRAP-type C4-dicarboxylate transport system, periplasmic component [Geomicrobium sp. JCM 19039]|nr:LOW QUALITY PROTEIN: TRAP-type C4-dicarboxylate transport system, periplasmic component [Geomicrobium sp. JCM 19039]